MNTQLSNLLYEYLIKEKSLSINDLGTLQIKSVAPTFNTQCGIFHPRKYYYDFTRTLTEPLEEIIDFLADRLAISVKETSKILADWGQNIIAHCRQNRYNWLDVGSFFFDEKNEITFKARKDFWVFSADILIVNREANLVEKQAESYSTSFFTDDKHEINEELVADITNFTHTESDFDVKKQILESIPIQSAERLPVGASESVEKSVPNTTPSDIDITPSAYKNAKKTTPFVGRKNMKVYTEFVELDAPERYSSMQKIFIIVLLIGGMLYIFFHLFLNDFSFHSYAP